VNGCKPQVGGRVGGGKKEEARLSTFAQAMAGAVAGGGLHSSTIQLNLSRLCNKSTPCTAPISPNSP